MTIKRTKGKIKVDYGMSDYYKHYIKNSKNPVKSVSQFNHIVSEFNKKIAEAIINEELEYNPIMVQITFAIRKHKQVVKIVNNKLLNKNPVDWKTTNQLWSEDSEAKEKKLLIRYQNNHSSKYIFRIKMMKTGYSYTNKKYYKFKPCRSFARNLAKRILNEDLEPFQAYNLY
jgi:hypothetical protein